MNQIEDVVKLLDAMWVVLLPQESFMIWRKRRKSNYFEFTFSLVDATIS
ncbi:MAG: hypothetical protein NC543_02500 [bacterium]|nr:hypothetical protein [bacterium]MCM1374232.1 hypothetical protein [Muribaculum sp.]